MSNGTTLTVAIDYKDANSRLAYGPTAALAGRLGGTVDWQPFVTRKPRPAIGLPGQAEARATSRGERHTAVRARYTKMDLERYARRQGVLLNAPRTDVDTTPAAMALLWLKQTVPARVDTFNQRLLDTCWSGDWGACMPARVADLVGELGAASGFEGFTAADGDGPGLLAETRARLEAAGVFDTPAFLVAGELFLGRQHLPLIERLLTGTTADILHK